MTHPHEFNFVNPETGHPYHVVCVGPEYKMDYKHPDFDVHASSITTSNVTVVEAATVVVVGSICYLICAHGDAIRHPDDKQNAEIGEALAFSRALKNLAYRIEKIANGQVKHLEDIAQMTHRPLSEWNAQNGQLVVSTKSDNSHIKPIQLDFDDHPTQPIPAISRIVSS